MTQALNAIGEAVQRIDASSRRASHGVRAAIAFGIVAACYGLVVAGGVIA
jgi:hypothetical protein